MKRRFDKMHGLGNDFVIVDARSEPFEVTPGLARAIADRRTGVAAIKTKRITSPVQVTMPGGSLTVSWVPGEPIRMRGSATHVFSGELDLEALQ